MNSIINRLEAVIADRGKGDPDTSYVARMRRKGRSHLARKMGEEAVETVVAAVEGDRAATISESADLLFHQLMLLAEMGIGFDEILAELERREGLSGIAEKAARTDQSSG